MHENEKRENSVVGDHTERIVRLESDYMNLKDSVDKLTVSVNELTESLRVIKGHFTTIKWLGVGALGAVILQNLGLVEAIKLMFLKGV